MKEMLLKYLQEGNSSMSTEQVLLNFLVSIILSIVIYLSYRYSHSKAVYSQRFNVSLSMLTIVTTMVMNVIGNNIALSLGMVGALSIVRFRTAIKDPRDSVYIFWCIVVGICCGVSEYTIAGIGSAILFIFLLIFGHIKSNDRYLLVIHAKAKVEEEIEKAVLVFYDGKANMRVKNTTSESVEYIYELSQRIINSSKDKGYINRKLYELDGVERVNLVCQNEDINR